MKHLGVGMTFGLVAAFASAQDASLVARGKNVYAEQKCQMCHSVAGAGNTRGPLDGVGSKLAAADIREWITNAPAMAAKAEAGRKPAMKAYALPTNDLDALVAYLLSLKR